MQSDYFLVVQVLSRHLHATSVIHDVLKTSVTIDKASNIAITDHLQQTSSPPRLTLLTMAQALMSQGRLHRRPNRLIQFTHLPPCPPCPVSKSEQREYTAASSTAVPDDANITSQPFHAPPVVSPSHGFSLHRRPQLMLMLHYKPPTHGIRTVLGAQVCRPNLCFTSL